uniref:uncharacterized protein LOC125403906 n=1 Tax=Myodes glareolus TaxID=447135 RepID=UPI0020220C76|nr:uncharacterized protein LOC125403906 [Myodes glareolus]
MSPNRTPRVLSCGLECCSLTQKNRAGTAEVLESRPFGGCHPPPHPQTVSGQTKPGRPGRRSQVSVAGRRSYPGLVQGAAASPGLGCRATGRARLGGAGPRGDEMAAGLRALLGQGAPAGRRRLRTPGDRGRGRALSTSETAKSSMDSIIFNWLVLVIPGKSLVNDLSHPLPALKVACR